jgi:hypothetical protein
MLRSILLGVSSLLLTACAVSGHYESSGPCKGFHTDQQACQRAAENSAVIGKVKMGQSLAEVRQVMGKDPERRGVTTNTETWGYLTDYMDQLLTVIVFKNGAVAEIKQVPSGE